MVFQEGLLHWGLLSCVVRWQRWSERAKSSWRHSRVEWLHEERGEKQREVLLANEMPGKP
jgi:hypothetical protein